MKTSRNLLGPFFINGSLDANKYNEMLRNDILPSIQTIQPLERTFYMQDGASSHTALQTRADASENLDQSIVLRVHRTDLNLCVCFFWGFIHDRLYARKKILKFQRTTQRRNASTNARPYTPQL
ncbi:hypothetical protein ABEB36_013648 [Hypothenemus hampei]|uniref:Transposase n=1 Tax=Hypothenemus hampei TaxID=57062 RepID=A0ABD1E4V3_HYPHA